MKLSKKGLAYLSASADYETNITVDKMLVQNF